MCDCLHRLFAIHQLKKVVEEEEVEVAVEKLSTLLLSATRQYVIWDGTIHCLATQA